MVDMVQRPQGGTPMPLTPAGQQPVGRDGPTRPEESPSGASKAQRKSAWQQFVQNVRENPGTAEFLTAFGTTLLQPVQPGQSPAGQFGVAVQNGMQARQQAEQQAAQARKAQQELKLRDRQVGATERQAGAAERRAGVAEDRERRLGDEEGLRKKQLDANVQLAKTRLQIAQTQLAEALKPGGGAMDAKTELERVAQRLKPSLRQANPGMSDADLERLSLEEAAKIRKATQGKDRESFINFIFDGLNAIREAEAFGLPGTDTETALRDLQAQAQQVFRAADQLQGSQGGGEPKLVEGAVSISEFNHPTRGALRLQVDAQGRPVVRNGNVFDEQGNPIRAQ